MNLPAKPASNLRYNNPDHDPRGPYFLADVTSYLHRPARQYEWHGQFPPAGRSWRYSVEQAHSLEAEGRIVLSKTGKPRIKRYLSEARSSTAERASEPVQPRLELIVRTAMRGIATAIAQNPACLQDVEWRDLERVLREVFERLGFAAELTRSGKDGGFDLRLQCEEDLKPRIFLVEVKHWAGSGKKPGRATLTSLIDVVVRSGTATTGLLLSSTGFTADVMNGRTEIEQRKVRLGGKSKIVSLCQNYLQSDRGIWNPTTELADMLLDGAH